MLRFLEANSTIINHKSLIINVNKMRDLIDFRHFIQLKWCNSILRFFQGLVAITAPASRKDCYLDVERMTQLYNVFINKNYPSKWKRNYVKNVHESLGLFLVQYLGNGCNLVDVAQLTYSQYFFGTERRAFRFYRKKTRLRSKNSSGIIIP